MNDKVMGMLGLARRAGKIIFGSDAAVSAVRSGGAKLVIMAEDASERTKKLMTNKCKSFSVPLYVFSNATELGNKIGKSDISVLAVSDKNFAKAIESLLN